MIWGTDTGHIYATFDNLVSPPVDLGQPHGAVAVTALWVHELTTTRLWAAYADGAVFFGELDIEAQTATWVLAGTIPEGPVNEIRESYGTFGELRATAGQGYYVSQDGGATWTALDSGDVAWRMTAGWEKNLYSFLNDPSPLREESGTTITLPVLVPPVEHIRGLTTGWRTPMLYAVDDQARLFAGAIPADGSAIVLEHVSTAPVGVNHMIRSGNEGAGNGDVIYLAGDDGVLKWFGGDDTPFYVRQTAGTVYMVGYGDAHTPRLDVSVEVLRPTYGGTGGGVWHYVPGAGWTLKNSGLPADWYWIRVRANPFNQDEWLVLGGPDIPHSVYGILCEVSGSDVVADGTSDSPLWYTNDNGASFQSVALDATQPVFWLSDITFSDSAGAGDEWAAIGTLPGITGRGLFWRGVGAASTATFEDTDWLETVGIVPGIAEDYSIAEYDSPGAFTGGSVARVLPDGGAFVQVVRQLDAGIRWDRLPMPSPYLVGARVAPQPGEYAIWRMVDYRSGTPAEYTDDELVSWVTTTANTAWFGGEGDQRTTILKLADVTGTPSISTAQAETLTGSAAVGMVRAGRRFRQAIAAAILDYTVPADGNDCWVSDNGGNTWDVLEGPSTASAPLANQIEVLERGG